MRRYNIVSGILLAFLVVDFALAAPVLVQEKQRQDVITVSGKRGMGATIEELDEAAEEYIARFGNSVEASSRPEPDHRILQAPAQNPPLVNAHLYPWMESSSAPMMSLPPQTGGHRVSFQVPDEQNIANLPKQHGTSDANKGDDVSHWLQYSPTSSGYDSDRAFFETHPPQSNHLLSTTDSDPETDSESTFNWNDWMSPEHSPPPRPASATEPGHEVVTPPSTDPESQSLGKDSQPEDPQAAIYAARGKAKVSGTVRDVGNLA